MSSKWSGASGPLFLKLINALEFVVAASYISPETGKTMMWVPRRSITKRTWPGKLDVTVGGGMGVGDTALNTVVRECPQEASLNAKYVRNNVRSVGVLPFPNRSPANWILPGMYYLFDLPLRPEAQLSHERTSQMER
ncbi:hypothetical protein D9615_003539 [Tricholomella constricta]|uniref:Nudix hydrolase domain-containing protein n=1 Tax=Tricholomella constricta TaxID=117010 RepID=A0A8H5M7F8_9AGAR|nr:hypothetical protein D9615_003539 [Tricholomella constricta]